MADDLALTREVADFVISTDAAALPETVVALGKKSILDGIGLALAGGVAKSGELVRQHLAAQYLAQGPATVIGTQPEAAGALRRVRQRHRDPRRRLRRHPARGRQGPRLRPAHPPDRAGAAAGAGAGRDRQSPRAATC